MLTVCAAESYEPVHVTFSDGVKWFSPRRGRMRVLITGGAGRLGISTCRMLQKKGLEVRVFDLP